MAAPPTKFGLLLFPQWEVLDVFGPIEALNVLIRLHHADASLAILSHNMEPLKAMPDDSPFQQAVLPTHTFDDAPDMDVLLVPGGLGTRNVEGTQAAVDYIRAVFPRLHTLITVCTGAGLAARAGALDGRRATTNKAAWVDTTDLGRRTHWIAAARWVRDGNVWTTAGISAGTDGVLGWIESLFGEEVVRNVSNRMEYTRVADPLEDPFSKLYDIHDVFPRE